MKCAKYKDLLNKWAEQELALIEINEISVHCEKCEECKQEYLALIKYKNITNKLKHIEPVLMNKELFVDEILNALPDQEKPNIEKYTIQNPVFLSNFRRAIASLAAALVMLFSVQQTLDAWHIKQLEERISSSEKTVNYGFIRSSLAINYFENRITNGLISRLIVTSKIILSSRTINKYYNKYPLSKLNKLSDSDFSFLLDSKNQLKLKSYENK